ncbi:hypothetical protein HPB47_000233, partial [Ixodes persulcatus]
MWVRHVYAAPAPHCSGPTTPVAGEFKQERLVAIEEQSCVLRLVLGRPANCGEPRAVPSPGLRPK